MTSHAPVERSVNIYTLLEAKSESNALSYDLKTISGTH